MFSSAAANERWSVQFDPSPSTSSVVSLSVVPGRKRKANFSNDETEALVWNVVRHFSALYGSETFRAHPVRRKQLWTQIQSRVNLLGYTERSIDDLKHKWRDLRLDVKKKISAKKPPAVHQAGTPYKPQLTPLEKMVASTFLQPTHDPEPEIVLDPEIYFPGTSQRRFGSMKAATSHSGIYIHTNGQPSTLPEMEGFIGPHLGVRSPDLSLIGDYSRGEEQSSSADSGPELQIPEPSTVSPPLRNDSRVSYTSEEEDAEDPDGDEGLDPQLSAEEDLKFSNRQGMLLHRWSSQGSLASEPEDTLTRAGGHSECGHDRSADLPVLRPQTEEEESEPPNTDLGSFPRGLIGPAWEKQPYEDQQQQPSVSPLGTGTLTEESLPPISPCTEGVSPSHSLPWRIGGSRLRENRREPCRATLYRLMEMEDQWDQLYHHELAVWQEERAQQREERVRDRDLQLQLLTVLTEIRDELRCLRQERAASRQERASQTGAELTLPCLSPKPEASLPKPSSEHVPLFYPGKTESCLVGASLLNGGRGERGIGLRSPQGIPQRGRGRPRGSASRHKRLLVSNR
ncbi:uncharacterized protein LOC117658027 isoform X1 [Pantherophis guttatus]|uniref:Uncharacterized protein LOC117658027 isoform X1 n=1 Tax=Pantherophis guttatus TaxID=94885 RepID=A0A6P9B0V4_PANGU|nr:uncharacterized protein LOC117658027 isoform X1 [Pantherophis guttatus]